MSEFAAAAPELLTLRDWLRYAVSAFNRAGLHFGHGSVDAYDEAAYLLLHGLHLPLDRLDPFLDARLTGPEKAALAELLRRRVADRVPAAYLTREAWLGENRFYVDERVLVPRSFIAEILHDGTLAPWLPDAVDDALDLCAGSGCLAVLLALAFPEARVDAGELSPEALAVARRNVADYGLQGRVRLVASDLFAELPGATYDLIISNPPYVTAAAMAALPPEYRHEPDLGLAGGGDGLDVVRRILDAAPCHLRPGGLLVLEIGHNRDALEASCPHLPFVWLETSAGDDIVCLLRCEDFPAVADPR